MTRVALLLLALGQVQPAARALPLHQSPAVELWCPEDWPVGTLQSAARGPGVTLAISTRSNMLRPQLVALLERSRGVTLRLSPALVPAHLVALRRLPLATLVLAVPPKPGARLRATLERLGPQTLRLEVAKLDAETAAWLAGLKNAEVELDVRGRLPDAEELARLRGLTRLRRVVRLSATDPPELVRGVAAARPVRLVVESEDARLPEALRVALVDAAIATRVRVAPQVTADAVRALAGLPGLSLELVLTAPGQLAPADSLLRAVAP